MKHANSRVNILILDACRSDPFSRSGGGGLAAPPTARGMFIAYATEAGKVAADGSGKHGVFTKYLINNLNKPIGIDAVFNQTQRDVSQATNFKQFPEVYDKFIGDFFFTLPKSTATNPKKKSIYSFTSQKPKTHTLSINPTPSDARVQITNIKPRYYKGIALQGGTYTIKVSKEGYYTKTGNIELYDNQSIDVLLEKKALHVSKVFAQTSKPQSSYTSSKNSQGWDRSRISGAALFKKCTACHGAYGEKRALGKSRLIAGTDVAADLAGYKAGITNKYGMGALMKGEIASYSDADIAAVAAYIKGL